MSKQMLELAERLASMPASDAVRDPQDWAVIMQALRQSSADSAEEKMPVARPVAFRVPRVVNDRLSKTEFRLFDDEDEARRAACDIGADYDGLFLVADRRAAFFAQPRPSTEPQSSSMASDDPTASKEWNDGCDFAMTQLCKFLDVEPSSVSWDAATETVEGDVSAVIGNILRAKLGEDWGPHSQAGSVK